jgi:hypothetical protein
MFCLPRRRERRCLPFDRNGVSHETAGFRRLHGRLTPSGVDGTPSLFIDGRRYRGPRDAESLALALEASD